METTTLTTARTTPRFRVPLLVWMGIALLAASVAGVGWGLHVPASDGTSVSQPPDSMAKRGVAFGHVDVQGGVISLYPLQPGRVTKINVKDNEEVKEGTALFEMDATLAKETLAEAEADLLAAEAQLTQAKKMPEQQTKQVEGQLAVIAAREREASVARLKREEVRRLIQNGLAREDTYQMADETVKGLEEGSRAEQAKLAGLKTNDPQVSIIRAEQDVQSKKARVKKARFGLSECTLTAPCDGTVLRLLVSKGETLGANPRQAAVEFCPEKLRIIRAEVEQEFADRVVPGQTAYVQDDTRSGPTWKGKVTQVGDWFTRRRSILLEPLQFNDVRTLECIIELDSSAPRLRIGQRVRVILDGSAN